MHFWGPDQRHGFEKRPIGEYWAGHIGAPTEGGPLFTGVPYAAAAQTRLSVEMAGVGTTSYHAFDELVTKKLLEYLDIQALKKPGERPFAATAGFLMPHCPYFAPKELFDYYYERVDVPIATESELNSQPQPIHETKKRRSIHKPFTREQSRASI